MSRRIPKTLLMTRTVPVTTVGTKAASQRMILLAERHAVKMMTALGVDAVELAAATSVVKLMRPRTRL